MKQFCYTQRLLLDMQANSRVSVCHAAEPLYVVLKGGRKDDSNKGYTIPAMCRTHVLWA